jgi:nitrate/nitrite transporter NarK
VSRPAPGEAAGSPSLFVPCFAGAAQTLVLINHAPLLPLIMRDFGITPAQAGLLSAAMFLGAGLLAIPAGHLTDWIGARRMTVLSIVILGVSTLALAVAPSYLAMLAIRFFSGAGVSSSFIAVSHYVNALWSGPGRALAQGLLGGSMQLGMGVAIFVLPWVAEHSSWRMAFAVCALPLAAALALWLPAARSSHAEGTRAPVRKVVGDPAVWRLGLVNASTFSLTVLLGTWIAVYFVHEFGLTLTASGMLGSQASILGMLGRPLGGVILARDIMGARSLIRWTLTGSVLALLVLALPGRPVGVAVAAVIVVGMTAALSYAGMLVIAARVRPEALGTLLGVVSSVATLTVIVGAPLMGALLSASGSFTLPLIALAVLPAVTLWATTGLPRG